MKIISPNQQDETFRVEKVSNCTLMFGTVPVMEFVKLTKKQPKDVVMDENLARMAQATMAFGLPADCQALKAQLAGQALFRTRQAYPRLTEEAITWLATGEQGISARFMFQQLTGAELNAEYSYPHDPSDLRRCLLMLEAIPEIQSKVGAMGSTGPEWQNLVYSWGKLTDTLEAENPQWRKSSGSAPQTYNLMQKVLEENNKQVATSSKSKSNLTM